MVSVIFALPPLDVPSAVVGFATSVGFLSVTFTWTPPSFLGVPDTLDPADFIYYILSVRNDTDSVGGATVPHPTTTAVVNLTYPCENYTATIFARNRQAGNGPTAMETFTLNETSLSPLMRHTFMQNKSVVCMQCAAVYVLVYCISYVVVITHFQSQCKA